MISLSNERQKMEDLVPVIRQRLAAGERVCIVPRGTSMLPLIRHDRDAVELAALPPRLKKFDLPLYYADGRYILHRVIKVQDNTYTCLGDNRLLFEPGLTHDQMIAVVTAVYRDGKRIDVNSFGYQCYCRLRYWCRPLRILKWKWVNRGNKNDKK